MANKDILRLGVYHEAAHFLHKRLQRLLTAAGFAHGDEVALIVHMHDRLDG